MVQVPTQRRAGWSGEEFCVFRHVEEIFGASKWVSWCQGVVVVVVVVDLLKDPLERPCGCVVIQT